MYIYIYMYHVYVYFYTYKYNFIEGGQRTDDDGGHVGQTDRGRIYLQTFKHDIGTSKLMLKYIDYGWTFLDTHSNIPLE